jgi:hypothetical protein
VRVDLGERRRAAAGDRQRRPLSEALGKVVFPVPGGRASTMRPLGRLGSLASRQLCIMVRSAVPSSRSLTPGGVTTLSHGPSWWSAGSACTPTTPLGSVRPLTDV